MVSQCRSRQAAKCTTRRLSSSFYCSLPLCTTHSHFTPAARLASPGSIGFPWHLSFGSVTHTCISNCKYLAWLCIQNVTCYRIAPNASVVSPVFIMWCDASGVLLSPHQSDPAFNEMPDSIWAQAQFVFVFRHEGVFALLWIRFSYNWKFCASETQREYMQNYLLSIAVFYVHERVCFFRSHTKPQYSLLNALWIWLKMQRRLFFFESVELVCTLWTVDAAYVYGVCATTSVKLLIFHMREAGSWFEETIGNIALSCFS